MKRMKINILCINKVKWQGAKKITSGTFEIHVHVFYLGGTKHKTEVYYAEPRHEKNSERILDTL